MIQRLSRPTVPAIILTIILGGVAGCGLLDREEPLRPGDLSLKLSPHVEMRLLLIKPMNLLVGKYEVTNQQYRKFKPDHDSGTHNDLSLNQDDQPAVNVRWDEAVRFCEWLTANHGEQNGKKYRFRLPTEKEWMTFAASGHDTEYPWGDEWPPPKKWNYYGIENPELARKIDHDDKFRVSAPVRKSGVNAWGLYGVGGNVWEWCADQDGKSRVIKGASWADSAPLFLSLSRRNTYEPNYSYINLGFRVVAEPAGADGKN
ncbi:MAG: formylglycine-generating enzyme family protein [Kiritimatiellia bacterium]